MTMNFAKNGGPYFIVEEGQFNLGDINLAQRMIEMAAHAGADAIEFQLAYADDFYQASNPGYGIYKSREFSDNQLGALVSCAQSKRIDIIATCLSPRLAKKMADFGVDGFNINASDINNPDIIDAVVKTKKPFFVSVPLATEQEIDWAYHRIMKGDPSATFAFLHGQHPMASGEDNVLMEHTALGFIKTLADKYSKPVGFIDHTNTVWMPAIAVSSGATVITKHMTLSHLYKGPDHPICLNPDEMSSAISQARKIYQSIRTTKKELAKGEDMDRTLMRRSVVSAKSIVAGEIIERHKLVFKRPGTGIPPHMVDAIIGRVAVNDIPGDVIVEKEMIR